MKGGRARIWNGRNARRTALEGRWREGRKEGGREGRREEGSEG